MGFNNNGLQLNSTKTKYVIFNIRNISHSKKIETKRAQYLLSN